MRARGIAAALVVLSAVGAAAALRHRVLRAGPVDFVPVDAFDAPAAGEWTLAVDDQRSASVVGRWGPVALEPGLRRVSERPTWHHACGTDMPSPTTHLYLVLPWRTEVPREVRLPVGRSLPSAVSSRVAWEAERLVHSRSVEVTVVDSLGAPVPGVHAQCWGEPTVGDAKGVVTCPQRMGAVTVRLGAGGLGAVVEVPASERTATASLLPAMNVGVRADGADAGTRLHFTWNSRTAMLDGWSTDGRSEFLGIEPARGVLCVSDDESVSACDVLWPDGGPLTVALSLGPPGAIDFQPTFEGRPVRFAPVWLDRQSQTPSETAWHLVVAPGRHVLVINRQDGPERFEAVVDVPAGGTTQLGTLELH